MNLNEEKLEDLSAGLDFRDFLNSKEKKNRIIDHLLENNAPQGLFTHKKLRKRFDSIESTGNNEISITHSGKRNNFPELSKRKKSEFSIITRRRKSSIIEFQENFFYRLEVR